MQIGRNSLSAILVMMAMVHPSSPARSQSCPVPGVAGPSPTVSPIAPGTVLPQPYSAPIDCTGGPPPPPPPPPPPNVVNGVCGSDDGATLTVAPTNLCSSGTASAVSGSGPWSWSCIGSGGGTNSLCSAALAAPPPPPPTMITFGETTVWPETDNGNGNHLDAQDVMVPQACTLQSLSFYVRAAAGNLRLGLYDNSGNIIVQSASFAPRGNTWNTAAVGNVPIQPGIYWLAYFPSSNSLSFPVERSSGQYKYATRTFGAMPPTFPAVTGGGITHWSFYATCSVP